MTYEINENINLTRCRIREFTPVMTGDGKNLDTGYGLYRMTHIKYTDLFSSGDANSALGPAYMRKTPHKPEPGLRGEIPPCNRILCIFISRLHDESNTTGIVNFSI